MRRWVGWIGAAAIVGSAGCGPKVPYGVDTDAIADGDTEFATSDGGPGDRPGGGSPTSTSSTGPGTAGPTFTSGPVTTSGDPTATATSGFPTTSTTTSTTGGGLQDGDSCSFDQECASGFCYVLGLLGGSCGECNSDADCPGGGCSPPNPLTGTWAQCNEGNFGDGCDSDEVCIGPLVCGVILEVPGVITESTCGQCRTDLDCPDLCSPDYDIANLSGAWRCVNPGTVPNGAGCDLSGSGEFACVSGLCATASVMGLLEIGVCSECEVTADCLNGTCFPASVDLQAGLIPGVCG